MTKPTISLQELRVKIGQRAKSAPAHRFWGLHVHIIAHTGECDQSDRTIEISRSEATLTGCVKDVTRSVPLCQVSVWKGP